MREDICPIVPRVANPQVTVTDSQPRFPDSNFLFKMSFYLLIFREKEGGVAICCSTYLCIHWFILICALTGDRTCSLGVCSNQLNELHGQGFQTQGSQQRLGDLPEPSRQGDLEQRAGLSGFPHSCISDAWQERPALPRRPRRRRRSTST